MYIGSNTFFLRKSGPSITILLSVGLKNDPKDKRIWHFYYLLYVAITVYSIQYSLSNKTCPVCKKKCPHPFKNTLRCFLKYIHNKR